MSIIIDSFLDRLPAECREVAILPKCRTALRHVRAGRDVWVVLLTLMPGQACKAWKLRAWEYWSMEPRYGSRDRYIRENMTPTVEGKPNPVPQRELSLF